MYDDIVLSPIKKSELVKEIGNYVFDLIKDYISKTQSEPSDVLLTQKETAKLLKCSVQWLVTLKNSGKIPYKKINSRVFYSRNEIMAMMREGKK